MLAAAPASAENVRPTYLADLPTAVLEALPVPEDGPLSSRTPLEQLRTVLAVATPYEFDMGVLVAYTDPRWFATLVPGETGAPILELRRWPGDSILSLYALEGAFSSADGGSPPVPRGRLELQPTGSDQVEEWRGVLETEGGQRPAVWREVRIAEGAPILGALLLPGDAGLGPEAIPALLEELRVVLAGVNVRPEIWPRRPGLARGTAVVVGETGEAPGAKDERVDPWQVIAGTGFSLGLPPGVLARRTDGGVPPPVNVPGGRLWLRGRFTDTEGNAVVIGDERVVGYVAEPASADDDWLAGKPAPVGAPGAERLASESFPLLKERTGALSARVERWKDPGFAGQWMVFRMRHADGRGTEIGLPVVEGRRSASVFWIPLSWRGPGEAPAPPPVDPAERFGIKFERLGRVDRQKQPWMEGYLTVPGLVAEIPLSWWPAASLRSENGYPVRLLGPDGGTLGLLAPLAAADVPGIVEGWETLPRPGVHRAKAVYRRGDGSRLFVAADGSGLLFEVAQGASVPAEAWDRMLDSVQLRRSGP